MLSVLHLLRPEPDGNDIGARSLATYRQLLPGGSYLAVAHVTDDGIPPDLSPKLAQLKYLCDKFCNSKVYCRSRSAIRALLGDFDVVDPGMVWTPQWHPEEAACTSRAVRFTRPNEAVVWAGVGRKPVIGP
jgi:hypothetical protein